MAAVLLLLSACGAPMVERPEEVGGISRDDYRAAYLSGDSQRIAQTESTIHVNVMADWRFDQLALRAGQTIPVGSKNTGFLVTCLPDNYVMVVPRSVQGVNLPTMTGIYLAKTGYHCDNGGEQLLAGLQSGEHFARLVAQGIFTLANTGLQVTHAGGSGDVTNIDILTSSGAQATSEVVDYGGGFGGQRGG